MIKQYPVFFVLCLSFCVGIVHARERTIWASNYPLSFFAETISGKPEIVIFPEIKGDPAFWEPNTADILTMQQSDIILLNGATYEKWLTGVALPKRKIVDTSKAFKEQYIKMKEAPDHSHGPGGEHSH